MPIFSLERLFDPPARIEEREREQEARMRGVENEDGDPPPEPELFRCRVCAAESEEWAYCADCLADTMERVVRERT